MNNMTKKLINDGNENKRKKMTLSCARIGMGLFALSLLSYLAGVFLIPVDWENYFSTFSRLTMLSGFLTFFVMGIKSVVEMAKEGKSNNENRIIVVGFGMIIVGFGLYALNVCTGVIHGGWGIGVCFLGVIVMVLSRLIR